jgi:hypothetical protein
MIKFSGWYFNSAARSDRGVWFAILACEKGEKIKTQRRAKQKKKKANRPDEYVKKGGRAETEGVEKWIKRKKEIWN